LNEIGKRKKLKVEGTNGCKSGRLIAREGRLEEEGRECK
jgi:hypothetical protein